MSSKKINNNFQKAIQNEDSLKLFLKKMGEFQDEFCELMFAGSDFTLRLEVRGNKHELLHVRKYTDDIERPNGAQKRIDDRES